MFFDSKNMEFDDYEGGDNLKIYGGHGDDIDFHWIKH